MTYKELREAEVAVNKLHDRITIGLLCVLFFCLTVVAMAAFVQ